MTPTAQALLAEFRATETYFDELIAYTYDPVKFAAALYGIISGKGNE